MTDEKRCERIAALLDDALELAEGLNASIEPFVAELIEDLQYLIDDVEFFEFDDDGTMVPLEEIPGSELDDDDEDEEESDDYEEI